MYFNWTLTQDLHLNILTLQVSRRVATHQKTMLLQTDQGSTSLSSPVEFSLHPDIWFREKATQ